MSKSIAALEEKIITEVASDNGGFLLPGIGTRGVSRADGQFIDCARSPSVLTWYATAVQVEFTPAKGLSAKINEKRTEFDESLEVG